MAVALANGVVRDRWRFRIMRGAGIRNVVKEESLDEAERRG